MSNINDILNELDSMLDSETEKNILGDSTWMKLKTY